MIKRIYIFITLLFSIVVASQELQADVNIIYSNVQGSNNQVFKTLEKTLKDFINQTQWGDERYSATEKIQCAFTINILEKENSNQYKANLVVQSNRPVYNSTLNTTLLNFQDPNFTFQYSEFETLIFNERRFSGKNLTDVIGYYIYMILGYDKDSFQKRGGTKYFEKAKKIGQNSENNGFAGWNSFEGPRSRNSIISDILKPQNFVLRDLTYSYHIQGLDKFYQQETLAKTTIFNSLIKLKSYENNSLFIPLDIFIESKKDEISSIFSGGISITANLSELTTLLNTIAPKFSEQNWSKIKP